MQGPFFANADQYSTTANLKVAVVLHLFYEKQWPEFREALANLQVPYQLFISLPPESRFDTLIFRDFPEAIVRKAANLGRDVAPFVALMPELQAFDAVCKIHSKRSDVGHQSWRRSVINGLLGTKQRVETYLAAFAHEPDLVLAGPRKWYIDGPKHGGETEQAIQFQHGKMPSNWGFFAGTMFWCRPQVFAGLERIYPRDIFTSHTDDDGHPEHAIERLFGLIPHQAGKKILLLDELDERVTIDLARNLVPRSDFSTIYSEVREESAARFDPPALPKDKAPSLLVSDIHDRHQGFVSDKWTNTLLHYDRIMPEFRDRDVRLLEIGVQNGGSLEVWASYFAHGRIFVGCDIDPACAFLKYADPRISIVCADASAALCRTKVMELSGTFDLIIDDGSHRSGHIIASFLQFLPILEPGGIYIAEDLHCSYWPEYEGGLDLATSALAFFRVLTDLINKEHWRGDPSVSARFEVFTKAYNLEIDPKMFEGIVSIEFANSLVVLRKGHPQDSLLGQRRVRGQIAQVNASVVPSGEVDLKAPQVNGGAKVPTIVGSDAISISVVVPFFNGSTYLPAAIESVRRQSRPAREIIIVDDGSDAKEAKWLADFAKTADFRIVTQQTNTGQGGARNAGISAATSTHICLLDQDDLFLPHHNQALVETWREMAARKPSLALVFADLNKLDEAKRSLTPNLFPHRSKPVPDTPEEFLARDAQIFPSTTLIERGAAVAIGGFDTRMRGYEDDDLYLRLVLAGYEIAFCPKNVSVWRRHPLQTSQSEAFLQSAETFFAKWLNYPWPKGVSADIARTNLRARFLASCRIMLADRPSALHPAIRELEALVRSTPDPAE